MIDITLGNKNLSHLKSLGNGTQGETFLYLDDDGNKYTVKRVDSKKDHSKNEVLMLKELIRDCKHINVPCFYGEFLDQNNLYFVYDFVPGVSLYDLKRKLNNEEVLTLAEQIMPTIKFLHRLDIVHRDIKAQNIIYSQEGGKKKFTLIDFGLSCKDKNCSKLYGTLLYMMHGFIDGSDKITLENMKRNDFYSFFVTLYFCCNRDYPYDIISNRKGEHKIQGGYNKFLNKNIYPEVKDFIEEGIFKWGRKNLDLFLKDIGF